MNGYLQAQAQEVRNGITFCMFCKGQYKGRCSICRQQNSKIRKEFPQLVEYWKYVQQTKVKLKRYNQPTTGVPSLDADCQPLPAGKPSAVVTERNGIWYAYLFYNHSIYETGSNEREAKGHLALKAAGWQPSVYSPNWRDYVWKRDYADTARLPDGIPAPGVTD